MIIHFINRSHKILPPIRCLPLRQNSLFIGNHSYSTGIKRRQFNKCSHSAVHSDSFLASTAVYQRSEQPNILNRLGKCLDFNYYSQVEKRVTGNACTFCRKKNVIVQSGTLNLDHTALVLPFALPVLFCNGFSVR